MTRGHIPLFSPLGGEAPFHLSLPQTRHASRIFSGDQPLLIVERGFDSTDARFNPTECRSLMSIEEKQTSSVESIHDLFLQMRCRTMLDKTV